MGRIHATELADAAPSADPTAGFRVGQSLTAAVIPHAAPKGKGKAAPRRYKLPDVAALLCCTLLMRSHCKGMRWCQMLSLIHALHTPGDSCVAHDWCHEVHGALLVLQAWQCTAWVQLCRVNLTLRPSLLAEAHAQGAAGRAGLHINDLRPGQSVQG